MQLMPRWRPRRKIVWIPIATVPRDAIFGRVFLIYWPLGRFGKPGYDKNVVPPGEVAC